MQLKTGKQWWCDFLAKGKPGEAWYAFLLWSALVTYNWHTHVIQATMGIILSVSVKCGSCHLQEAVSEHYAHCSGSTSGDSSNYINFASSWSV